MRLQVLSLVLVASLSANALASAKDFREGLKSLQSEGGPMATALKSFEAAAGCRPQIDIAAGKSADYPYNVGLFLGLLTSAVEAYANDKESKVEVCRLKRISFKPTAGEGGFSYRGGALVYEMPERAPAAFAIGEIISAITD